MPPTSFPPQVCIVLRVSIEERIDPCHRPLLLTELLGIRSLHALSERALHPHGGGVGFVGTDTTIVDLPENGLRDLRDFGQFAQRVSVFGKIVFPKEPQTVGVPGGFGATFRHRF